MGKPKTLKSLISKVIIRRRKTLQQINDLVRATIMFSDQNDMDEFVNKLKRKKDIITGYEHKSFGADQTFGYYGSHHFSILLNGIECELQVMTKKLEAHKTVAHGIYDKYREMVPQGLTPSAAKEVRRSKGLYSRANIPKAGRKGKRRSDLIGSLAARGESLFLKQNVINETYDPKLVLAILEKDYNLK